MTDPTVIGRYKIVNRLGRGGMGALFLAHDPAIDRMVAIKVMREGLDSAELRERFGREARAAGRLRHPNIVTIFDVGDHDGQPFIAMEYVPGETLEAIIQRRVRLPLAGKLKLIEELCDGLAYAHKAGVVHRDIKPANLMLDSDGTLKILDFGIVRFAQSGMTQAGMLVGTLAYMSPEQVGGKPIDYRSDIFAVGDVAYELLSGKQAFTGSLQDGIMNRILHEAPKPLDQLCSGLDREIVRIVSRALEKDPGNRYQDLTRMRRELARVRERLEQQEESARDESSGAETVVAGPRRPTKPDSSAGATPRPPTDSAGARATGRREVEQRRQARIQQNLEAAERALAAGDFESAIAAADDAALLDPNNERALEIIERAHAAAEDKQVQAWLDGARDHLNRGDTTQAAALVEQARALRPGSTDVRAMLQTVDEVRRELELARERAHIVREAVARARADFAAGSFEMAIRAAEEALARQPQHTEALAIKEQASTALEEQRRREQHDLAAAEAIDTARREFDADGHEQAIARLAAFAPPHPEVSRTLQQMREEALAIRRRREEEEREALRRKVAALLAAAEQAADSGRHDEALGLLHRVRELDPDSNAAAEMLPRVLAMRSAAEAAARAHAQVQETLRDAGAALAGDEVARAAHLLDDALRLDPQSNEAAAFRQALLDRADALLSEARVAAAAGRYDDAVAAATRVRSLPSHESAAAVVVQEALEQKAAAERTARTQALVAERLAAAGAALEQDDLGTAARLHQDAYRLDPAGLEVAAFGATLRRRLEALLAAAADALQGARLEEAQRSLDRARELEPDSPAAGRLQQALAERRAAEEEAARTRSLVEGRLAEADAALARGELDRAAQLQEDASRIDGAHEGVQALAGEIARRRRAVEEHIAAARGAVQQGDFNAALEAVARGRALDAGSATLTALGDEASAGIAAVERERQQRAALEAALAEAAERLDRGELDGALRRVEDALAVDGEGADARALQARIQQALSARGEAERREAERRAREARIAAALEKARSTRAHDEALEILRRALESDGEDAALRASVTDRERARAAERARIEEERREAERRARDGRVAAALEKAGKAKAHDQAIGIIQRALEADREDEQLLAALAERRAAVEAQRARAEAERREAERRAREGAVTKALEKARKSRSPEAAVRILREALVAEPENEQLLAAIHEREAAAAAATDARAATARASEGADAPVSPRQELRGGTGVTVARHQRLLVAIGAPLAVVVALGVGWYVSRDRGSDPQQTVPPVTSSAAPAGEGAGATGAPAGTGTSPQTAAGQAGRVPLPPAAAPSSDTTAPNADTAPVPGPRGGEPPVDPAAALERQLEPLRQRARQELARGQLQQALATAQNGLKLKGDDRPLRGVLNDVVKRASEEASAARTDAERSGASTRAASVYQQALRLQRDGQTDVGAGRHAEAARSLWSARDAFVRAAGEAKLAAAAETTAAERPVPANREDSSSAASSGSPPPASPPPVAEPAATPPAPTRTDAAPSAAAKPADTAPRPEPQVDETAAVQQAVRNNELAYNAKNVDAIRRVQVLSAAEVKGLENMFREAVDYKMTVRVKAVTIGPEAGQATVTCLRRIEFRSRFGTENKDVPTTLTLQKRGNAWMIVKVAAL